MLDKNFTETFNAAVKSGDWKLVTVLGESAISESAASVDVKFNLGLAYLKTNDYPMAESVFLSVPATAQDQNFKAVEGEAFRLAGFSSADLDLSAHGLTGTMVPAMQNITTTELYASGVVVGALTLGCAFAFLWAQAQHQKKNKLSPIVYRAVKWLFLSVGILFLITLGMIASGIYYKGHWGVVVSSTGSVLHTSSDPASAEIKTLKLGKPIFVHGDATTPWIRVLESDGGDGWVNALEVRVIRE